MSRLQEGGPRRPGRLLVRQRCRGHTMWADYDNLRARRGGSVTTAGSTLSSSELLSVSPSLSSRGGGAVSLPQQEFGWIAPPWRDSSAMPSIAVFRRHNRQLVARGVSICERSV